MCRRHVGNPIGVIGQGDGTGSKETVAEDHPDQRDPPVLVIRPVTNQYAR